MTSHILSPITFDALCYRIEGKPVYLYSGEMHYFRVPKTDWSRRMKLLKEAGGNCVATYIPWLLHEPEESTFRFGEAADWLDLDGNLLVRDDPYAGLSITRGQWAASTAPGLGVHPL